MQHRITDARKLKSGKMKSGKREEVHFAKGSLASRRMAKITLQDAVDDLFKKVRTDKATTSTSRLQVLAEFCVQELGCRGLKDALIDPEIPGFARAKDWDVAWFHNGKARLAISLKSLLANLQMYSPEIAIGYVMVFNTEEDVFSKKHRCTWCDLLRKRLVSISGRKAPHWTVGTVEAAALVEVDFKQGAKLLSGAEEMSELLDMLAEQVRQRNPDLRSRG